MPWPDSFVLLHHVKGIYGLIFFKAGLHIPAA